jgi:hypothetical protein
LEDLTTWKICVRFLAHCLTDEEKAHRLQASQELIRSLDGDYSLLGSIVTGGIRLVSPVRSPNKNTKHGMALFFLYKTHKNCFRSKKSKWCWSHSADITESFAKNVFHQARRWIRNVTWKYCLVRFID